MKTDLSHKAIFKLALPMMLGTLAQNVINITDTAFLARLGEADVGAGAIGGLFYITLFMLGFGFGQGGQILIARRRGENRDKAIGSIYFNLLYFLMALGIMLSLFIKFLSPFLLSRFISSPDILAKSLLYLDRRAWGLTFAFISLSFRSLYTGLSDTRILGWNTVFLAAVNAVLAYILIFGAGPIPARGIAGAGDAAFWAEVSSVLFFLPYNHFRLNKVRYGLEKLIRPSLSTLKNILNLSLPMVFMCSASLGGWLVFFTMIEKLGPRELAISNIIRSIYMAIFLPIMGFQPITSALTSQLIGEGRGNEIGNLIRNTMKLSFGLTALVCFLVWLFPNGILELYTNDPRIGTDALEALHVILIASLIFSLAAIPVAAVSGTGDTKASMSIEFITITFYLSFTAFMVFIFRARIEFVWMAEWIYWGIMGGLAALRLKSRRWKNIKV